MSFPLAFARREPASGSTNTGVRHAVGDGVISNIKRFWRYGLANARLRQLTTASPIIARRNMPDRVNPIFWFNRNRAVMANRTSLYDDPFWLKFLANVLGGAMLAARDCSDYIGSRRRWSDNIGPDKSDREFLASLRKLNPRLRVRGDARASGSRGLIRRR